ncbi:hypothetical protein ACLOJK_031735 [Asimina triloba]
MREKAEDMKPILLKAGIPLALTLAGFLFSIIIIRGKDRSPQQDQSNSVDDHVLGVQELKEEDDLDGLHSTSLGLDERVVEEEEEVSHLLQTQDSVSLETSQIQCPNEVSESEAVIKQEGDEPNLKEEPEDQTNQVGAVQDVEGEVEVRFLHHCSLHEHGSALKELQSALELELAHVEFLGEKVESMAAENQRLEAITAEYPRVVKALLSAKSEVGLLRRRIKKLWKMNTEATHVLRRQALVMKAREAEISSKEEELQWKEGEIRELENAMVELRGAVDQMEKEKKALVDKLEVRESSATPTSKVLSS